MPQSAPLADLSSAFPSTLVSSIASAARGTMHPSNWSFWIATVLLISTGWRRTTSYRVKQQKRGVRGLEAHQSVNVAPYWEYILRESVFRTLSPPGNNALYKRLLDAPFYDGPFPIVPGKESSVVLSRGDVYYLPNNRWILCQEGCTNCEACGQQKSPVVKWILRRIKRVPSHGPTRHDLQLTITPQVDGSYHMKSLWPRSYVYVTSQGERTAYLLEKSGYLHAGTVLTNRDDGQVHQYEGYANSWRPGEGGPTVHRHAPEGNVTNSNSGERHESTADGEAVKKEVPGSKYRVKNFRRPRLRVIPAEKPISSDPLMSANMTWNGRAETKELLPKLILGTDPRGQKHLVHVVPADHPNAAILTNPMVLNIPDSPAVINQNPRDAKSYQEYNASPYQLILRKIFDSLSLHRKPIEDFLDPALNRLKRSQRIRSFLPKSEKHESSNTLLKRKEFGYLQNGIVQNRSASEKWNTPRRKPNHPTEISNLNVHSTNIGFETTTKSKDLPLQTVLDPEYNHTSTAEPVMFNFTNETYGQKDFILVQENYNTLRSNHSTFIKGQERNNYRRININWNDGKQ